MVERTMHGCIDGTNQRNRLIELNGTERTDEERRWIKETTDDGTERWNICRDGSTNGTE